MRICAEHWKMMRESVDQHGMSPLVSKDTVQAFEKARVELEAAQRGQQLDPATNFDPLMSHNWHWCGFGMKYGGLAIMFPDPVTGGDRCPMCEWVKNVPAINARAEIDNVSKQMQTWCIERGLIARPS